MSDRLLEVVGVNGVLHLGSTQIGIGGARRLAQCSELVLRIAEKLPMQVDGEPTGEVVITPHSQAFMLQKANDLAGLSAAVDAIDACMDAGTISAEQRNILIREMARRSHRRRVATQTRLGATGVGGMRSSASMSVLH
eukprot:CAMPEP_0179963946 /NCGR_PEP_ID=MMETSP0983-20121128/31046_1 /TAXON_ID=483367 /ORGANISM="non described non described, Strain CCMP 2436" /LENGTH=137 /DNA_ID=CAMNT_0021876599 /DNA_START=67 /DNA_END=480 /DNA_ORIENTATION=-